MLGCFSAVTAVSCYTHYSQQVHGQPLLEIIPKMYPVKNIHILFTFFERWICSCIAKYFLCIEPRYSAQNWRIFSFSNSVACSVRQCSCRQSVRPLPCSQHENKTGVMTQQRTAGPCPGDYDSDYDNDNDELRCNNSAHLDSGPSVISEACIIGK
jgi:hypothetical protein